MRHMDPVRRRSIIVLGLTAAAILVLLLPIGCSKKADIVKTNEERVAFLESLGWTVDPIPTREQIIQLPREFPQVLMNYNELQKEQGFDLTKYAGKQLTMYSYRLIQQSGEEKLCTLYVYKNRVVGGDIHTVSFDGAMEPIK